MLKDEENQLEIFKKHSIYYSNPL